MTPRRIALVGALVLAASACKPPPPPSVQIVGESEKVRRGEAPPRHSAIFDGKTVRLRGVRGETLGLQVILRQDAAVPVAVALEAPGVRVDSFRPVFHHVREPSSALFGRSHGTGHYPDLLRPEPQPVHTDELAYFDVVIGAEAPPGRVEGIVTVGDERFPLVLLVDAARIDLADEPLVWVWYHNGEVARAHGLADDDGEAQLAWERRYIALFRAHGAYLSTDPSVERYAARRSLYDPDVRFQPVRVERRDHAKMAEDVRRWSELFAPQRAIPFAIPIDEPRDAEARARVNHNARVIRAAGGGAPRFLHTVTDHPQPDYAAEGIDVFISPRAVPGAARDAAYRWTYNGREPQAGNMTIDKPGVALRTWGWIALRYQIDLWYAWEGLYFTDRYNDADGPTHLPDEVLTYDERRRSSPGAYPDYGNGDGLLAYPGALPSLRLKALRRGLQDRLLLRELARCGGAAEADDIVRSLVPQALAEGRGRARWPKNELRFERARHRVLDALARRCDAPVAQRAGTPGGEHP